ncbi:MAG: hypothetical protein KIG95_00890, partial [Comamonas sp.]|nr:hypothetical protein [Comamonas sp.]
MLKRLSRLIRKLPSIDQASMVLLALLLAYAILAGKTSAAILPTSAPKPAMIRPVLNSMVLQNTFDSAVSAPTDKRGFVTPKFCEVVFRHPIMVMG